MLVYDIAEKLEDAGVGVSGTNIFASKQVLKKSGQETDNCVTIYDTGGLEPDIYLPVEYPTFEVLIRNKDYSNANAKAYEVYNALHGVMNTTLRAGGFYFYYIFAINSPQFIGYDSNGRAEYSINFKSHVRSAS